MWRMRLILRSLICGTSFCLSCRCSTHAGSDLLGSRPESFLRLGSWIGGDRDGNPHVTADSLRLPLGRASQALLADYLDQLHALGAELSISNELAEVSDVGHRPGGPQRRCHCGSCR